MPLRIGLLKCDKAPEKVIEELGDYDQAHLNLWLLSEPEIEMTVFECHLGAFPTEKQIQDLDGFVITGSRYSAYDDIPWIWELKKLIRKLDEIKKKLVGICFGHQVIAEALGGRVAPNEKGWTVSVSYFVPNFLGKLYFPDAPMIRMQYMHQDIVVNLGPSGLLNLGHSPRCSCQALCKDHHIITFQGHPEYKPLHVKALMDKRLDIIPKKIRLEGEEHLNDTVDMEYLSKFITLFLSNQLPIQSTASKRT